MYRQISFHTQSQQSTTQPLLTKYNIHDNNNGKNDKNRSTSIIFVSFFVGRCHCSTWIYVFLMNNRIYFQLFVSFLKIGAFTFGGGWAMISVIEREIVDNKKWIGKTDFLDLLALAQSIPGILAVNIAAAVGDKIAGKRGAVVAALGSIIPSFVIILLIAMFLTPDTIKGNDTLRRIFMGIRPAVVALIIAPVVTSAKAARLTIKTVSIPLVVALMISLNLGVVSNPIIYIILGGTGGYLFWAIGRRKLDKTGKA